MQRDPQGDSSRRSRRNAVMVFGLGTLALSTATQAQFRFARHQRTLLRATEVYDMVLTDLDADGTVDAAAAGTDGYNGPGILHTYLHTSHGALQRHAIVQRPGRLGWLRTGDLDSDGYSDLLWTEDTSIVIWYNRGDGAGGELHVEATGLIARHLLVEDLDGDGTSDIAMIHGDRNNPPQQIAALFSRGRGVFEQRLLYQHPDSALRTQEIAVGDIDGDGDRDIAALYVRPAGSKVDESELVFLSNDGTGNLIEAARWRLPWSNGSDEQPHALITGDLDGDGDLDFLIATNEHYPTVTLQAFRNDRDQLVRTATLGYAYGYRVRALMTADLDLDGRVDAIFSAERSRLLAARNVGNGLFGAIQVIETGEGTVHDGASADIYGNGQWDVAVVDSLGWLAIARNFTFTEGPRLFHGPLVRGEGVTFKVYDAEPGETVHFLRSLTGAGHTRGQTLLGGMVLDLLDPIVHFGSATADANGTAVLRRTVPPGAPLTTVATQAVIRRGPDGQESVKTPFHTARIQSK